MQVFVPGFAAKELPLTLPNINNIRYRPDGKLVALGYDGDVWVSDPDEAIRLLTDCYVGLLSKGEGFLLHFFDDLSDALLEQLALERLGLAHARADEAAQAVALLREHGIEIRPSWLPFTPWATPQDILEILDFVIANEMVGNVDPIQYTIRLLVPKGSDIESIEDLAGKTVGVQQGTTGKTYTEENAPKTAKIPSFPSDAEMYQAIQAGQVDALLQDLPVNLEHTKDGKFVIVEEYETNESYGLALKKGNELLEDVNAQLAELKSSGEHKKLYDKYFEAN